MTELKDSAAATAGGQVVGAICQFIPYTKAKKHLASRLGASAEEIAAWIFMGPVPMAASCRNQGPASTAQLSTFRYWPCLPLEWLAAYAHANEFDEPPRFHFDYAVHGDDYLRPLQSCWFRAEDIAAFRPMIRYITGQALRARWQSHVDHVDDFISYRIGESSLQDIHPTGGMTEWSINESSKPPSKESALFLLTHIEAIEAEHGIEALRIETATDLGELMPMPETRQAEAPAKSPADIAKRHAELSKTSQAHTKQTAEEFGVSTGYVRQCVRDEKAKPPSSMAAMTAQLVPNKNKRTGV